MHILNLEHTARIASRSGEMDFNSQALSTKEHIRQPRILDLYRPSLTIEVERNVTHVRLHLPKREREIMEVRVLRADRVIRGELQKVVRIDGDDIGQQILALHSEVLDDEIHRVVGVLDARDRDVPDVVDELRDDDAAQVRPEMRLECEVAVGAEQEVLGETLPVLAETRVERVVAECEGPGLDLVEQVVLVRTVLLVEERVARVAQAVRLL